MWNSAKFDDKTYFFRVCIADERISFHATNLEGLWTEEKDLSAIFARAKELNKRIEYDEDTVLSTIKSVPAQWEFQDCDETLSLKYYVDGRPFYFKWNLAKRSANDFKDIVMQTLFVSLATHSKKTEELLDVIKKKDAEISQYKIEGAVLKRNKVETVPFSENEFSAKYPTDQCDAFVKYARDNCESTFNVPQEIVNLKTKGTQNNQNSNKSKLKASPQKRNRKFIEHSRLVHKIEQEKLTYTDSDNTPPMVDDAFEIEQSLRELQRLQKEDKQATSSSQPPQKKVARRKFTL